MAMCEFKHERTRTCIYVSILAFTISNRLHNCTNVINIHSAGAEISLDIFKTMEFYQKS